MFKIALMALFFSNFAFSQKIDKKGYDKFENLYKISTADQMISPWDTADVTKNVWVKVIRYVNLVNDKPAKENISVFVYVMPRIITAFDGATVFKVIFDDNTIKTYKNEAAFKVWGEDETATIFFTVPEKDLLRTKNIKAIKLQAGGYLITADISNKSTSLIKDMIALTKGEKIEL